MYYLISPFSIDRQRVLNKNTRSCAVVVVVVLQYLYIVPFSLISPPLKVWRYISVFSVFTMKLPLSTYIWIKHFEFLQHWVMRVSKIRRHDACAYTVDVFNFYILSLKSAVSTSLFVLDSILKIIHKASRHAFTFTRVSLISWFQYNQLFFVFGEFGEKG